MATYGKKSLEALSSADPRWTTVMRVVITIIDNSILYGNRSPETQFDLFKLGRKQDENGDWQIVDKSKVVTYKDGYEKLSTHNTSPSKAIDAVKYPIDWEDREGAILFAGFVLGVAKAHGWKVRWGGDWDGDADLTDQSFMDLYHFEFID
ncbi:MAG: M15 family peptidase [Candidatus Brocadiales bacterium]|nr:M15 family peptidase [Candidatus Brocadiales bacterium]